MKLDFLEDFSDAYLKTDKGRGVFLAGVLLGYMAKCQVANEKDIKNAPLFKQIEFGRLDTNSLKKLMARVPKLIVAYDMKPAHFISALAAEAGKLMLGEGKNELGAEGNFAFTVGFGNATDYFWRLFKKQETSQETED
ncbi:MAG: CRISPR-associated protein [Syntrophomonadaceae bacterium]|nr:CRISPR-associated protein [Syntrophomonadaceae bacterium]